MKLSIEGMNTNGVEITPDHFGVNATSNYQDMRSFNWSSRNMDLSTTRYPGGSESEEHFDFENPHARVSMNGQHNLIPMNEFLTHCVEHGIRPQIVIPMTQLLTSVESGRRDFDENKSEALRWFVTEALSLAQPTGIKSFELGNEYQTYMDSVEYGRVASAAARIVKEQIEDFSSKTTESGISIEPIIEIQVWGMAPGLTDEELIRRNENVISEFNQDELNAVGGASSHFYFKETIQQYQNLADEMSVIFEMMDDWRSELLRPMSYSMSEWSVQLNTDNYTGLRQIAPMLEMFSLFVGNGANTLQNWSMQYHNTSVATPQGDLTLIGQFMEFFESSVLGMEVVNLDLDTEALDVHGFSDEGRFILFVSSLVEETNVINMDLSAIVDELEGVPVLESISASKFSVEEGSTDGIFRRDDDWDTFEEPDADLSVDVVDLRNQRIDDITFQLGSYQVMLIEFELEPAILNDTYSDFYSFFGNDAAASIRGLERSSLINGSDEGDEIYGGFGDDTLYGWNGDDFLRGGRGDDTIVGGIGDDVIHGDEGSDTFVFNEASGRDVIVDFQDGFDLIELVTSVFSEIDDVDIWAQGRNTVIDFGQSTVTLLEISAEQIGADDFVFTWFPELG